MHGTAARTTPERRVQVEHGPFVLRRRIGSTTYNVGVHFSRTSRETMDEKILRLVRNDLNLTSKNVTMDLPQTGRLSERGSP